MGQIGNDVIKKEMILLSQEVDEKEKALDLLIKQAAEIHLISSKEPFLEAVFAREAEVPTAIGYQIAIPHGKSNVVQQPFIGFLQTKQNFIWTKNHEEEVRLIFLIGVPAENENNIHLKFISQLSKRLLDDDFREQLLVVDNVAAAHTLLSSISENHK